MEINRYIDHTLLAADATKEDILKLCKEAITHSFYSVCVNSSRVGVVAEALKNEDVFIAATIGFPLGSASAQAKIEEAINAMKQGADELDMVMNIGEFKDGNFDKVLREIKAIKQHMGEKVLKVIIETCYLTTDEIDQATKLIVESGAEFVKTSTGFGSRGASFEDIRIMSKAAEGKIKIKASGGIRDKKTAQEYIKLGASRIGASSGVKMMT